MVENFTTALLETRITAVLKTVPFRYSLELTPEIKALIARKNYETLNSIVEDVCQEFQNNFFCQKLSTIQPNHKSLSNFTKINDGVSLLTGLEKAESLASKFSAASSRGHYRR
jgi:hypothetical protein